MSVRANLWMAFEFYGIFFYNSHIRVKLTNPNPLLSSMKRSHFKVQKNWSWNEQKYGHGCQWGLKPRMTVLT
jgi:hypothetical protein